MSNTEVMPLYLVKGRISKIAVEVLIMQRKSMSVSKAADAWRVFEKLISISFASWQWSVFDKLIQLKLQFLKFDLWPNKGA